ncbi:CoA transferase [Candidatus Burkholderia verschuerenii]|uniref:CoA transferase n=1 Tax=Candidatus Burkholderia verschuerenii TaxID=242163 RepID=UPI00067CA03B
MPSALDNIIVLDLTSYLAGPYGCALLGDVGATVIKIEAPGGDNMRQYPSTLEGENRAFLGANRNKRSIVIDLKTDAGRQTLYRLVEKADVFVHNFRPSVPESLGIDYETLRALRSDLIYCSLTGYGESGPLFAAVASSSRSATLCGRPRVTSSKPRAKQGSRRVSR